jgi:hypothetical protein
MKTNTHLSMLEENNDKITHTPSPKRFSKSTSEHDYNSASTTPTTKNSNTSPKGFVKTRASDNSIKSNQLSLKEKLPNFTSNFDGKFLLT